MIGHPTWLFTIGCTAMDSTPLVPEDTALSPYPAAAPNGADGALDESLVADARAGLTPADMVERKLSSLLRTTPIPVSQISRRRAGRAAL